MRELSLKALVLGLVVGVVTAVGGLLMVVAAAAAGRGIDITDIAKNGQAARHASIQLPILSTWLLALLLAGMTTGRVAGRALRLHGAVIGLVALLAALAGVSRQDPIWATALVLGLTIPMALAGAHVGPAPGGLGAPPVPFHERWALVITLPGFCVATIALAASDEPDPVVWLVFIAAVALLGGAIHGRFRPRRGDQGLG
jgi:hypothetical protein